MKRATLETWESLLGEEYTEDVRRVWDLLLDCITTAMCEGCTIFEEEDKRLSLKEQKQRGSQSKSDGSNAVAEFCNSDEEEAETREVSELGEDLLPDYLGTIKLDLLVESSHEHLLHKKIIQ
ncbi:unnamed protein product [Protopolystoma xenopodis]|uniref:Uncharacterized protein n=1 Tax=Protopolystoma xenopodis TaxID=117903 RepID=A0A3S5BCC6_9PLAT|nr:unnamed protein product [Protopolystoma xenopodis]